MRACADEMDDPERARRQLHQSLLIASESVRNRNIGRHNRVRVSLWLRHSWDFFQCKYNAIRIAGFPQNAFATTVWSLATGLSMALIFSLFVQGLCTMRRATLRATPASSMFKIRTARQRERSGPRKVLRGFSFDVQYSHLATMRTIRPTQSLQTGFSFDVQTACCATATVQVRRALQCTNPQFPELARRTSERRPWKTVKLATHFARDEVELRKHCTGADRTRLRGASILLNTLP